MKTRNKVLWAITVIALITFVAVTAYSFIMLDRSPVIWGIWLASGLWLAGFCEANFKLRNVTK